MKKITLSVVFTITLALVYDRYFRENPAYRVLSFATYSHSVGLLAIHDALEKNDSKLAKELVLISMRSLESEAQILKLQKVDYGLTDRDSWQRLRSILEKNPPLEEVPSTKAEPKRRLIPNRE